MIGADQFIAGRTQVRAWGARSAPPDLLGLLAITALLNLWHLSAAGWANGYYTAGVRSMIDSWHNFLFGSFDPSGVMTMDKPPLAFWVQALSARIFGFNSWSILVPQALMGIATVALSYDLVRRRFGRIGGFVAGLTLAITPVTVAVSRHNNPDAALILCCVAALWFAVRGLEDGRTKWIVWSGVMVGLGFEAKMGTALLVVPGLAAAWLLASPQGLAKRGTQLLAAGAALVAVGGAWPLLVALTPAADRPWISGTNDNSIWSLITGYNGLGRITGSASAAVSSGDGGRPGVFRLLNTALGSQAGWLLGFALVSGIGLAVLTRMRRRDVTTGWVLAVGGAFLTSAVAFSAAHGLFRFYYVAFLAPFSAALVGAGAAQLARGDAHARRLAPLAIGAGVATELVVLRSQHVLGWLQPIIIVLAAAAVLAFVVLRHPRMRLPLLGTALATLAIAPAAWKLDTRGGHATSSPSAIGSRSSTAGSHGASSRSADQDALDRDYAIDAALNYAAAHGQGTVAVTSQVEAESEIIDDDARLAGIGGFGGNDSQVTAGWLAQEARSGKIRWVLQGSGGLGRRLYGRSGSGLAMRWVSQACRRVPNVRGPGLYDCSGRAAKILQVARRTQGTGLLSNS
jgi:4-amino-4-deoxy-L-arabinose transferase-like glycosyltransferase